MYQKAMPSTHAWCCILLTQLRLKEVKKIKNSEFVNAIKLYPAGATTNSDNGVSDIRKVYAVIEQLEETSGSITAAW